MNRATYLFAMMFVFVNYLANDGVAQYAIIYTPSGDDVVYGSQVTYSITTTGPTDYVIQSYNWEYFRSCANAWTGVTATPTDPTETCYEVFVGTFTVRCTLTLGDTPGGPPPPPDPVVVTTTITVPPPDEVYYISGDGINVAPNTNVTTVYGIKCKGKLIGPGLGYPQEQISNVVSRGRNLNVRSIWYGPGPRFYSSSGSTQITDIKRHGLDFSNPGATDFWNNTPAGVIVTAKQDVRIVIPDPCGGNYTAYPLKPQITVKTIKNSDGTYRYEHSF